MSHIDHLKKIQSESGDAYTTGLSADQLKPFLESDNDLQAAIDLAASKHAKLSTERRELLKLPEQELIPKLQEGFLNFYSLDARSPYVPLASHGPWIITAYGSVVYDTGGYGMLGLGHNPPEVLEVMSEPQVMANIMTPSFAQNRFVNVLKSKIGLGGDCPFQKFICMNSGSESVSVALRISDINAKNITDPGGEQEGKQPHLMMLSGAFHGRTGRAAQASHSSHKYYKHLASFRFRKNHYIIPANDIEALERRFVQAERDGVFIECIILEAVMGEGCPGMSLTREFYERARQLTKEHSALLILDSIQASLRTHGVLSVVDYPGFEGVEAPDCETYSKSLNAGQFPLSVLAMSERAASVYKAGVYGNTMTANPRGLEVGTVVLNMMTDDVVNNIREKGVEFLEKLRALIPEFPKIVKSAQGTGLLLAAELDESVPVVGKDSIEEAIRRAGVNVIHGGKNALRFTPHFRITTAEIDLIVDALRRSLSNI